MTPREFSRRVALDIKAMMTGPEPLPFRAVVRDIHGDVQIVNVEAEDIREAADRASEFGNVTALWEVQ